MKRNVSFNRNSSKWVTFYSKDIPIILLGSSFHRVVFSSWRPHGQYPTSLLSHWILRQKYLTRLPFPPPGYLLDPGIEFTSLGPSAIGMWILDHCTTRKPPIILCVPYSRSVEEPISSCQYYLSVCLCVWKEGGFPHQVAPCSSGERRLPDISRVHLLEA